MTLRGRGIEAKKLNRERKKKERRGRGKRGRGKRKKKREKKKRKNGRTSRPTTDGETNVTTIHPVAPANYIMIFNGPKSKTRPPKIFGCGISWDGLESSEMT